MKRVLLYGTKECWDEGEEIRIYRKEYESCCRTKTFAKTSLLL